MSYLIVLNKNGKNQLEIYHTLFAEQNISPKEDRLLIDTAESYAEAVEKVRDLTKTVYEQTGDADLRDYLLRQQNEGEESVGV